MMDARRSPPDENLPEVVPDPSPQALTRVEIHQRHGTGRDEGDPKFAVVYEPESTTPKFSDTRAPMLDPDGTPATPCPQYSPGYVDPSSATCTDRSDQQDPELGVGKERICGMRRKSFLILLVVVIVVIVAAIGGGVGGAAAARDRKEKAAVQEGEESSAPGTTWEEGTSSPTDESDAPEETSTEPTSSSSSTPTSTLPAPTSSSTREPGFTFEAFTEPEFEGQTTGVMENPGFIDLPANFTSYRWRHNDAGCCVTFCQNMVNVGWWCQDRDREEASRAFDRVFFGCGDDSVQANSRCSDEEDEEEEE